MEGVIDYFKNENQVTGIMVFFMGKRITSIPRGKVEKIRLSYFKAQKFNIACNSRLLFSCH